MNYFQEEFHSPSPAPAAAPAQTADLLTAFTQEEIGTVYTLVLPSVLWIQIRRIRLFLGLQDPDPLVRGTDPAPDQAPGPATAPDQASGLPHLS